MHHTPFFPSAFWLLALAGTGGAVLLTFFLKGTRRYTACAWWKVGTLCLGIAMICMAGIRLVVVAAAAPSPITHSLTAPVGLLTDGVIGIILLGLGIALTRPGHLQR